MNLTPSQKGSFLAGVGLWVLVWASEYPVIRPESMASAEITSYKPTYRY